MPVFLFVNRAPGSVPVGHDSVARDDDRVAGPLWIEIVLDELGDRALRHRRLISGNIFAKDKKVTKERIYTLAGDPHAPLKVMKSAVPDLY
jgi:hypothetical protein